jgi:hypothetical protein
MRSRSGRRSDFNLFSYCEVLVRRTVAIGVARKAPARTATARRSAALKAVAEDVDTIGRQLGDRSVGGSDVVAHNGPNTLL